MRYLVLIVLAAILSGCGVLDKPAPVLVFRECPEPTLACPEVLPDKSGKQLEVWDKEAEIEFARCRQAFLVWRDSLKECNSDDVKEVK